MASWSCLAASEACGRARVSGFLGFIVVLLTILEKDMRTCNLLSYYLKVKVHYMLASTVVPGPQQNIEALGS